MSESDPNKDIDGIFVYVQSNPNQENDPIHESRHKK